MTTQIMPINFTVSTKSINPDTTSWEATPETVYEISARSDLFYQEDVYLGRVAKFPRWVSDSPRGLTWQIVDTRNGRSNNAGSWHSTRAEAVFALLCDLKIS